MKGLVNQLFDEGYNFDFFQSLRILSSLQRGRSHVGLTASQPRDEIVRFRAHLSLASPASAIYGVEKATKERPNPLMTVTFFGLYGPSGILPRPYTELLLDHRRDNKGPEREALRDWLDLFNHRLISLFYRAWQKYRFYIDFEQGGYERAEPDAFTQAVFSFVGLGFAPLRNRLRYSKVEYEEGLPKEEVLAHIDDFSMILYGGIFAQKPRSMVGLRQIIGDYFGLPVEIQQLQGQWMRLEKSSQAKLGKANDEMGVSLIVGERIWDIQSKFRIRLGPLRMPTFESLLPDRTPIEARKKFFLLVQMVRLYVGIELDFDIQLILDKRDIPECQLQDKGLGARLGWNTWLTSQPATSHAEDPVFEGVEV